MSTTTEANRKIAFIVIAIFLSATLFSPKAFGNAQDDELERQTQLLSWLDKADAKTDLRKAVERGDYRFLGCMGYSLEVPGVPDEAVRRYGVRMIDGTSDDYVAARLQKRARQYATEYNQLLYRYLMQNHFLRN